MEAILEKFQHLKIQLEVIKTATCNFDNSKVIGKGGFGKVYQGVLSHSKGQSIAAFKRLDRNYGQGDPEFWKEILMLSGYKHVNIISLLGYCDEDGEKILVYEHASHGSLDHHLSSITLTWRQRLKICLSAARGLSYLHDPKDTHHRVIHRDIKSSNILLDEDWNAKVSDLGLSKIGPANQNHTFIFSNVVGTLGYIDPLYMETCSLTKESDVYSFGVVLSEMLFGRLCFENNNGHFESLVPMWKQIHREKKLHEIIFQDLKQHMDPRSLEAFSDVAYQCLLGSREERPKMTQVVEKLETALWYQEVYEKVELPTDYEKMSKSAVPPLIYKSEEELKMLLSKGILVNGGKTWFWLNNKGEHCEMISMAECLIPIDHLALPKIPYYGQNKSRFAVEHCATFCSKFKTHVRTQFLSPHITYKVNLVFSQGDTRNKNESLDFTYILKGETKCWTAYYADKREDGWLIAELYQFTSESRNVDLEITFECPNEIAVEGIEFQPLERLEHEVLENVEVDMQTDAYWEQKLPSDYKKIVKLSKDKVQWTTKKELYAFLCKGFPNNAGDQWISIAKNGKKCHMLGARAALRKEEWTWRSSPNSRFEEVAFGHRYGFRMECRSRMLSPNTTYASFLVYNLRNNDSPPWHPMKVCISLIYGYPNHPRYAYLHYPQTPIIRPQAEKTHNPLNRPKMGGLPRLRSDGWMEVQVWKFQTATTGELITNNLQLSFFDNKSPEGLTVQGVEFRPV